MDVSRVAPELRVPMKRVTSIPLPGDSALGRSLTRALLAVMPGAKVEGVTLEKPSDATPHVRVYLPATRRSTAALFWIHGGGLIIGRAVQDDRLCAQTARALGIVVVSTEYRKAPEHPFPAALDDCTAAWKWMQGAAGRLGIDPARVVVGGESAGGGLAASLDQRLHDMGDETHAPIAQWLFCPMLDDRTAAWRDLDAVNNFVWNNRVNRFGWRSYLGVEPGAEDVPAYAVAARREDLSGLPPTWIGVGDIDLFADEDRTYAERLRAAGVEVTVEIVPGAPHGFEAWAPNASITRDYIGRAQAWLGREIGVGEPVQG